MVSILILGNVYINTYHEPHLIKSYFPVLIFLAQ